MSIHTSRSRLAITLHAVGEISVISYHMMIYELNWQILSDGDFVCPDGVAMEDFFYLAQRWLRADCAATGNCEGADLNDDGTVDLGEFAEYWLEEI